MAPTSSNGATSSSFHSIHDELIDSSVATATLAISSRLESLLTTVSSPLTGNNEIDRKLERIRSDLNSLTSTQSHEEEEIKKLLADVLGTQVLQYLEREIEMQIDKRIETTVTSLVEKELDLYIPKEIREDIDKQRVEMHRLHIQIYNSEARRVNGSVKTRKQFGEGLHHLLNERGAKSDLFPQTVNQLLDFDDAKVAELVKFYGMENPNAGSKIQHLNWFLREIGVHYQSNFLG